MKLLIAVVHNHYRQAMEKGLGEKGYRMTELSSTGSFRRRGNTTFLIGVGEEDEDILKEAMKEICLHEEAGKGRPKYVSSRFVVFSMDAGNGQLFANLTQT
ncbi:cyclic-di-AMP receptor [Salisediminibacterium beveridgei]|uniref:Protein Nitrogen Regulatory Protein P-II n=1 Tax=Salisediminibacterium beveridgei TaxID=632773 RepID=A0A1D7QX87_9BACI|nr:cyclic-di-AMP receptor [Salisediminibacterium beveridgei]AOM83627.1 Protein Nitrogen Regulatory Protein P-II [Salisediminibacterium beveridgei]